MKLLILLNLMIPFIMIFLSSFLKKHPVYDMSKHQGYNTPSSRKSQEHWDYAQSIAPDIFLKYGKVLLIFMLISYIFILLLDINMDIAVLFGNALGFIFAIIPFYKVEKQIRIKFQ